MDRQLKKKKLITAVAGILLIGVYFMIFSFSADDGETSSNLSMKVTKFLLDIYYGMIDSGEGGILTPEAADAAEGTIRKLAHFTEYMAVGFLSYGIAVLWIRKLHRGFLMVALQLVLSAGLDELHQYFVPERHASVRDVMLDTAGGIAGRIIILCVKGIKIRWNRTRRQRLKTCS